MTNDKLADLLTAVSTVNKVQHTLTVWTSRKAMLQLTTWEEHATEYRV